jgi:hypothetical protein
MVQMSMVLSIEKILKATEPETVFGSLDEVGGKSQAEQLRSVHQHLARVFHPDRDPKATAAARKKATVAMAILNVLRDRAEEKLAARTYGRATSIVIKAKNTYTDVVPLAAGDICDVYAGVYRDSKGAQKRVVLKIARAPRDADLLANEIRVLTDLHSKTGKEANQFQRYLPRIIESTSVKVGSMHRPTNVLSMTKESFTLAQICSANPHGIDAADMAWMWRRNLEILSWVHAQGYVHGAVIPPHVMVYQSCDPKAHFGRLMDWSYAVKIGGQVKAISSPYRAFYAPEILAKKEATPATDIFMSARCATELLRMALRPNLEMVPRRIAGLLNACMLSRPSARYTEVQDVYAEFDAILREVYGEPKFRAFAMPVDSSK